MSLPLAAVRTVQAADVPRCYAIEQKCFGPTEAASLERIARRAAMYPQGFWVVERGGAVVGFLNSGATNRDDISDEALKDLVGHEPTGRNLVIFSVAVDPSSQGQGLSRLLLEACHAGAQALEKQQVLLLCKAALVPYYARFGYVDDGVSSSTHGAAQWHQMRLVLDPAGRIAASAST